MQWSISSQGLSLPLRRVFNTLGRATTQPPQSIVKATEIWKSVFPRNAGRLLLGCFDADFCYWKVLQVTGLGANDTHSKVALSNASFSAVHPPLCAGSKRTPCAARTARARRDPPAALRSRTEEVRGDLRTTFDLGIRLFRCDTKLPRCLEEPVLCPTFTAELLCAALPPVGPFFPSFRRSFSRSAAEILSGHRLTDASQMFQKMPNRTAIIIPRNYADVSLKIKCLSTS